MQITPHFSDSEFQCPCCGRNEIHYDFVERLEKLYQLLDKAIGIKAIYVNSGYRCAQHSLAVGGYTDDCHVLGFAADIHVVKNNGTSLSAFDIAEAAQLIGFQGIGIITTIDCHIDDRGVYPYKNNHWYGHEKTGENYHTFIGGSKYSAELQQAVRLLNENAQTPKEIKIKLYLDDKEYSGLITED